MSDTLFEIEDLDAYYGQAQILEGVSLQMGTEGVAVIGRNGMGKTTLCASIMGMMPRATGSIRFRGREVLGRASYRIAGLGIGYVPQGRRLFPSLSVDEQLKHENFAFGVLLVGQEELDSEAPPQANGSFAGIGSFARSVSPDLHAWLLLRGLREQLASRAKAQEQTTSHADAEPPSPPDSQGASSVDQQN